jgi:hypothetical protein
MKGLPDGETEMAEKNSGPRPLVLYGGHARELADDGDSQVGLGTKEMLEAVGGNDEKGHAPDGEGGGRVGPVPEEGHLPEQISLRESPKNPLPIRRPSPDLDLSVVHEIGLPLSSIPLAEDHLSRPEAPGLHPCDSTTRCGHWGSS